MSQVKLRKSVFDEVGRGGGALPTREPLYARNGIAATPHPLVTESALEMLRAGGNAVDAAIAAAAVMMCVVPLASHIGGDAFCLVRCPDGTLYALNGSGAAPVAATLQHFQERGGLPEDGIALSTVPGVVGAWATLNRRFGKKSLRETLRRAIEYARSGVPVSARLHVYLSNARALFSKFPASAAIFLPNAEVPEIGDLFVQSHLADTFERIAEDPTQFYTGAPAREIVAFSEANDGLFSLDDFAAHANDVVAPLSVRYRGHVIYSEPPVSRGIITLLTLAILERVELGRHEPLSAQRFHLLIEAYKLATEDLCRLGDPRFVDASIDGFLSDSRVDELAARIDPNNARPVAGAVSAPMSTESGVFGDADGNVVAYIQSIYMGCGVVAGETGVLMNARMNGFSLDAGSPNVLAPRKRPMHTLNNYIVHDRDDELVLAGGSPGGELQVQINVQMLSNVLDYGMSVTEAVDHPRFALGGYFPGEAPVLRIESRVPPGVIERLREMGHRADVMGSWEPLSGVAVQIIARDPRSGVYQAASESRRADASVGGL